MPCRTAAGTPKQSGGISTGATSRLWADGTTQLIQWLVADRGVKLLDSLAAHDLPRTWAATYNGSQHPASAAPLPARRAHRAGRRGAGFSRVRRGESLHRQKCWRLAHSCRARPFLAGLAGARHSVPTRGGGIRRLSRSRSGPVVTALDRRSNGAAGGPWRRRWRISTGSRF